jgi:hypothetical protein
MGIRYPQERRGDAREKGEHPYKDEKETMAQTEAQIQTEAEEFGETHQKESEQERRERREGQIEERLTEITREMAADSHEHGAGEAR